MFDWTIQLWAKCNNAFIVIMGKRKKKHFQEKDTSINKPQEETPKDNSTIVEKQSELDKNSLPVLKEQERIEKKKTFIEHVQSLEKDVAVDVTISKKKPSEKSISDNSIPEKKAPHISEPPLPPNKTIKEDTVKYSSVKTKEPAVSSSKNKWFIVAASAIGKSHLKNKVPCQDTYYLESINDKWGIAICCDGAGSAVNSHIGSKLVASEMASKYFKDAIIKNGWQLRNSLPRIDEWNNLARKGFIQIYNSLKELAESEQIEVNSLACTTIIIIYSPIGLLVTHIGDGRAGYCNEKGEWKSVIVPHKGEEANQTIFVTSNSWFSNSDFLMSGVPVPESRVIKDKPTAFTLMTDGCELHSFECSVMDKKTKKWFDPNLPYPNFFNPLVANLKAMKQDNVSYKEANEKWGKFVEAGNKGIESEPDDKTMILGITV